MLLWNFKRESIPGLLAYLVAAMAGLSGVLWLLSGLNALMNFRSILREAEADSP
jgi:hypothetical protein